MTVMRYIRLMLMTATVWCLTACDGVMGSFYDDAESSQSATYGFLSRSDGTNTGRVYVDGTKYDRWMYINFHNCTIDSATIGDNTPEPAQWDIAIHRYDVKTNGGAVMATPFSTISDLIAAGRMPTGTFTEDVKNDSVTCDLSQMMQGAAKYARTHVNRVLRWIILDMSTMPPGYVVNKNVFIIRLKDGTYAAVQLYSYMNSSSVKGHITFDYVYPLNLNP